VNRNWPTRAMGFAALNPSYGPSFFIARS
jgi:hypothetical protein